VERQDAYEWIDTAVSGSTFFRFIVSPDPVLEDGPRDLHLRSITAAVMNALEERLRHEVVWVDAVHDDHTDHRHVHAVAIIRGRVERADLELLTQQATAACLRQRDQRDQTLNAVRHLELRQESEWDRELS
jgi:hypothetical protein